MIPSDVTSILDYGCGDGYLAKGISITHPTVRFKGLDVVSFEDKHITTTIYDGEHIPFPNNSFDLVMVADVLHHTENIGEELIKISRLSKKYIVIKDHLCESWWDALVLRVMDWVGNKSYGVSLPYNYIGAKQWNVLFQSCGLFPLTTVNKVSLYPFPLNLILKDTLQVVYLLTHAKT